jgi:copper transport protein
MATTPSLPRTDRRRLAGITWAALLAALVLLLAGPRPALGHAILLDADPAPNSVIPASPDRLSLFFSEAVDPRAVTILVVDSERRPVIGVGTPIVDGTGLVVRAELPALDPDTYTVEYSVVSAVDGHPNASIYAFVVDPTGTQPPPGVPLPPSTAAPADPVGIAARWTATTAALVLLGSVLVAGLHRRWIGAERRVAVPWRVLAALAVVAVVALLVYVARAADAAFHHGIPEGGLPLDPLAPFGTTPFANAMRFALAGGVGAAVIAGSARAGADQYRLFALGMATVVILLGLSLTGHAASLGGPVFAAVDALHLVSIAAWLGALPAVLCLARDRADRGAAFGAHARLALIAAPLVVLTGLANSPLVVDEPREVVAADYGNLLLTKALLVSLALGLGAANYFIARRAGARGLATLAAGEIGVAALAVIVGATMVSVQPATDRAPSAVDPRLGVAHIYAEGGQSRVHGIVNLPEPGVQSYSFAVADPETGAGREDVAGVTVLFVPPPESGLPADVQLAQPTQQAWIWSLRGAFTPVVGSWELEITVHRGRLVQDEMSALLAVRQVVRTPELPPPSTGGQLLGLLAGPAGYLPAGAIGWAVPVALLAIGASILAVERRRATRSDGRGHKRATRVTVLVAAIALGLSLTARDTLAVANRAPEAWATATNPLADDPAAIPAGEELYRANCASCHGTGGAGDGPAVPDLARRPNDLATVVPHRLDGELAWTIGAGVAGTQMPAFGTTLLDSERWELVSFLRSRWPLEE